MSSVSPNSADNMSDSPSLYVRVLSMTPSSSSSQLHTPVTCTSSISPVEERINGVDLAGRLSPNSTLADVQKIQKIASDSGVVAEYEEVLLNRAITHYKSLAYSETANFRNSVEVALINKSKIAEFDAAIKKHNDECDEKIIKESAIRNSNPLVLAYLQTNSRRTEVLGELRDKSKIKEYDQQMSDILYAQNERAAEEVRKIIGDQSGMNDDNDYKKPVPETE